MKNRFLKILMITTLTVSMLVGCGGTETGTDNGGTNTEVGTNSDETEKVDMSIYTESTYYYKITDEANYDYSLVDGEELQDAYWEEVNQVIKIKDSLDIHNYRKEKLGFTKENIECVYYKADGEWSMITFGTDFTEGGAFVKTDELKASLEVIGTSEDPNFNNASNDATTETMSEESIRVFNAIREGIKATSDARKANVSDYAGIVEADSSEGMEECLGPLGFFFDKDNIDDIVRLVTMYNNGWCTSYYIEFVDETDTYVEFNLYVK